MVPTKIKRNSKKCDVEESSKDEELQSPHNEDMGDQIRIGDGMTVIKEHGGGPSQQEIHVDQIKETVVPTKIKRSSKKSHSECSSKDVELQSQHNEEMRDQIKNQG